MAPTALAERARWLARVRSPVTLTLLGHAAMAFALFVSDGARDHVAVLCILACMAAWAKAFRVTLERPPVSFAPFDEAERVAWYVALGLSLLAFVRSPGMHVRGELGVYHLLAALVVALIASYGLDLRGRAPVRPALVVARRALLFLLAFILGAWILKASPEPLIDLFPVHQQTAQAMLDGKSIYEPGVISVLDSNHHTFVIRSYTYLPLSAYLTTAAFAVTHDIRWANLAGQLVGAGLLWLVARRCASGGAGERGDQGERDETRAPLAPGIWADLIAIALLFHPRGLLVLEKAWTEPLALPFLGGFVLLATARRPIAASVCLGLLCAIKQHLVLYVPFLMLVPGVGLTGVMLAGVVALLTMAPYLIRAPLDLYHGAFGNIVSGPFRTDALAIPAELHMLGLVVPTWVGFVAGLVPLAWLRRVPREMGPLLLGSCLVFGLFYLWGRQAFCNYYYLLETTALFAAAALRAPRTSASRA